MGFFFAHTLKSSLILQTLVLHGQMVYMHGLEIPVVADDCTRKVQFSLVVPPQPSTKMQQTPKPEAHVPEEEPP